MDDVDDDDDDDAECNESQVHILYRVIGPLLYRVVGPICPIHCGSSDSAESCKCNPPP